MRLRHVEYEFDENKLNVLKFIRLDETGLTSLLTLYETTSSSCFFLRIRSQVLNWNLKQLQKHISLFKLIVFLLQIPLNRMLSSVSNGGG